MPRRRLDGATNPNSAIDLTPLLDIVFIVLFIVIIAYTNLAVKNESPETVPAKPDSDLVPSDVVDKQNQELDKIVKRITITCWYDDSIPGKRTIRVITPDKEYDPIEMNEENTDPYLQLEKILRESIEKYRAEGQKGNGQEDDITKGSSFVVLILDIDKILRRDKIAIDELAEELMGDYDGYVFYRTSRVDK